MSQQEDMDDVRAELARTTDLAKLLFEQQFVRCGGRMPADPEWGDLEEVERDEWFERAVDARPLIDAVEASRRDWAADAMRLQHDADLDREPATWDLNHEYRDQGSGDPEFHGPCRTCGSEIDDERHDEPYGPRPPEPEPGAPCSCLTAEQAAVVTAGGFSLPRCAVHPEADR